tara:strand:+ start:924 stop:1709 length:786 start_codon:yes stop_codon:yes gene_type:complete
MKDIGVLRVKYGGGESGSIRVILLFLVLLCIGLAVLFFHGVDSDITADDRTALQSMFNESNYTISGLSNTGIFEDQIVDIRAVQDSILTASPVLKKIPLKQGREPADLLQEKHGQCGDRARAIEKALGMLGYNARYASLFSRDKSFTPPETMAIDSGNDLRSHAVVEVETEKGWMIVDTNARWISLTDSGQPVSLDELHDRAGSVSYNWDSGNEGEIYWLMRRPFSYIFGLYSRHGLFYPPYTPYIPDIDYKQFIFDNITD